MTQEIIPAYSTFQKDIDLTLYHAFAELVVQTAQDGEARILYRQLEARQIWQEDQNVSSYFEAYSLRYPGNWGQTYASCARWRWPWATPASVRPTRCL